MQVDRVSSAVCASYRSDRAIYLSYLILARSIQRVASSATERQHRRVRCRRNGRYYLPCKDGRGEDANAFLWGAPAGGAAPC